MPGLNLCAFFTPPVAGADFLAALFVPATVLVERFFLGAFPPAFFLAVCLRTFKRNNIFGILIFLACLSNTYDYQGVIKNDSNESLSNKIKY